ncbi:hypothetical protein THL1_3749 [Pseudomonas sp. TCU-HL1]|nr:hypothetical protein THL1_3749 [Pseudomonas sp. TCU-HL1]
MSNKKSEDISNLSLQHELELPASQESPESAQPELENDDADSLGLEDDDAMLNEIDEDNDESVLEELEALAEELDMSFSTPSLSLAAKLKETGGDFHVSESSMYRDRMWKLSHGTHAFPNNIRFDRELPGSNDLKRALIYYVIPQFSPFSYIRACSTTKAYGTNYKLLEQYIFWPNKLSAEPKCIKMISVPMLANAFEDARSKGAKSDAFNLFKLVKHWINLSTHKLIPEELRLEVDLRKIDTPERRKEIVASRFKGTLDGWTSYSEEDLEVLINYALFWVEGVMPKLEELRNFLISEDLISLSDQTVTRKKPFVELERAMTITIEGESVMTPAKNLRYHGDTPYFTYSWITAYAEALDRVRNAVFILMALVTGARKAELAVMHFDDLIIEGGEYWLRITRWKTAKDPIKGETDKLPLPKFIGEMLLKYKKLRSFAPFTKQGWLFQTQKSNKTVNKATPALINYVIIQLKSELPIDRLHCHRFRKTIAEILINRDERNVDIIRALFGHKSYAMTLRYIARNPLMVRSVAIAIEQNYTEDFHEIVAGIRLGIYSGDAADRIFQKISLRPDEFSGKNIRLSLLSFITHLLEAGEPLFIRRTAVGTYCLTGERFSEDNLPPCLVGKHVAGELILPAPENCQPECKKVVILGSAKQALSDNIKFYSSILDAANGKLSIKAEHDLQRRIAATRVHLDNLESTGHSASPLIEAKHV